jgi:DNA-binding response OmpR family regulator
MVDDDEALVGIVAIRLKQQGFKVDTTTDSNEGLMMAEKGAYDLLILDVTMPRLGGLEFCTILRSKNVLTPVLMLSGNIDKLNIVRCLESGADDYLTKPFSDVELTARIHALIRRNKKSFPVRWIKKNDLVLDTLKNTASFCDKTTELTSKEVVLLRRLMNESPEPVTRELLLKDVWGIGYAHTSNRLDVYVYRVRDKLAAIGAKDLVHTVRSKGYSFEKLLSE